jgi:hypothetical protein
MTKLGERSSSASDGLADPTDERSNCGVGAVINLDGGRSHETVADGLELLENLEHRGTTGAEENTGDPESRSSVRTTSSTPSSTSTSRRSTPSARSSCHRTAPPARVW